MPESADVIYKNREQIAAELIADWTARIPDLNVGPDGIARMWVEVAANSEEGLYLAAQLTHDDMFVQTANALALMRYGEMYGRPRKGGTLATGNVRITGAGGTYVPLGVTVAAPRQSDDDALLFVTTADGTIPNPGIPTAPVAADASVAGSLTGTYEYAVTFVTAQGETELGAVSNALVLAASKANLTAIPLGGAGTISRNIYRRVNGGTWGLLTNIADNTTTTYSADNATTTGSQVPPTDSTAERIVLAAEASEIGLDYNVTIGAINTISDPQGADLSEVVNLAAFAGGSDQEDIEVFRAELLKRVRAPQSGSGPDLESWATEIDGVETATAFPNVNLSGTSTPGTVSVRITGPGNTIPDAGKVAEVLAYLLTKDLANITILVGTFTANTIATSVAITRDTGYTLADVTPSVQAAIIDYINSIPVGGTVYRAGIFHAVFGLPGVLTLTVTTPASDVTQTSTQKAVPSTPTVT